MKTVPVKRKVSRSQRAVPGFGTNGALTFEEFAVAWNSLLAAFSADERTYLRRNSTFEMDRTMKFKHVGPRNNFWGKHERCGNAESGNI